MTDNPTDRPAEMTEHIIVDLGDGTALIQRTGLLSATETPLADWERAIIRQAAELDRLRAEVERLKADLNRAKCALAGLALTADEKTAKAWTQLAAAEQQNAALWAGLEKAIRLMENGWCEPDLVRLKQVLTAPEPAGEGKPGVS